MTTTDSAIKALEKKLKKEYRQAEKELRDKYIKRMKGFNDEDLRKRQLVKEGKLKKEEYQEWRKKGLLMNRRARDMIDEMAKGMARANQTATAIINNQTAAVFADASNYQMFQIEKGVRAVTSFSLLDVNTVTRLALVPKATSQIAKDIMWNKKKIRSAIMQGFLQGESIPDIAKRLKTVARMNQNSAIRTARTFVTAASNDGNLFTMQYARSVGVKLRKRWLATLDERTRSSHAVLDGETVDIDETFSNDLMFPADPDGDDPAEIYNCRCTMLTVIDGIDFSVDPEGVTRAEKLDDMSYSEWKQKHAQKLKEKEKRKQERAKSAKSVKKK